MARIDKVFLLSIVVIVSVITLFGMRGISPAQVQDQPVLQITSPADGSVVNYGQRLAVSVLARPESLFRAIQVVGEDIGTSHALTTPPFDFALNIPNTVIGPRRITVKGFTDDNDVVRTSITVNIESPVALNTLDVSPARLHFAFVGETTNLTVIGRFSDGNDLAIRRSSRISYTSNDPGVATVNDEGVVTAIRSGATNIVVQYEQSAFDVPVAVSEAIRGDLNGDSRVDQDDASFLGLHMKMGSIVVVPGDARDLNHDGIIDQNDVDELHTICPNFPCPPPAPPPPPNPDQPTITSVSPSSVVYGSTPSQVITITGSNFAVGAIINVGGELMGTTAAGTTATAANPFIFVNSTTLKFWWPNTSLPAGLYGVTVNNPSGYAATLGRSFTITGPPPSINSLSPPNVTYGTTASQAVVLFGSGFMPGATITVGSMSGTVVAGASASAATRFVYVNSSRLAFYWPNTSLPPGSYDVQVMNPVAAGGLSATRTGGFTVIPPQPTVTGLSHPSLIYDVSASQSVTIFGTTFVPGAVITVGGMTGATVPGSIATATMPFVYVSGSQLRFYWNKTALVPGSYAVQVTNPPAAGGLSASLAGGLTVTSPQPTITSLDVNSVTYGITPSRPITVFGDNFVVGARITVGSLSGETVAGTTASVATPFVYVNKNRLSFYWPNTALPPEPHDVQVTNTAVSGGLSATVADAFTVTPPQPTVTSVNPTPVTHGISPGTSITIDGAGFIVGATVTVGSLTGNTVAGTTATTTVPFVHVSSTRLRFYWPNTALGPGVYAVRVTNPAEAGGLGTVLADGFTVTAPQPTVTSVSPTPVTYGISPSTSITVYGSNFIVGATIAVGSLSGTTVAGTIATSSTRFVHVSSTQVKFYWPNTALLPGVYAIQIANPTSAGGLSASLNAALTVAAPQPTVTAVVPSPVTYGVTPSLSITISGSHFIPGSQITVGTVTGTTVSGSVATSIARFVWVNSSTVRFWWPNMSLPPGAHDVTVTNPGVAGGLSGTLSRGFSVAAPAPTITSVSPTPVAFGATSRAITIFGSNFVPGATITVGSLSGATVTGSTATATVRFVYVNGGTLRFWWPGTSLPARPYDVQVTNPAAAGGGTVSLVGGLVVQ